MKRLLAIGQRIPAPGWLLLALVTGFLVGLAGARSAVLIEAARLVGGVWLDALRMTIVPLVFALVSTGMADLLARAESGRVGRRLVGTIVALLAFAAVLAAVLAPPLLALARLSPETVAALGAALGSGPPPQVPGMIETLRSLVPVNVVASAASGAIVPLVLFALVLGLALGRMGERAQGLLGPLRTLAEAMIVIVGWVLRAAPVGIFALALTIGATAGLGAAHALAHYLIVSIAITLILLALCYPLAWFGGGVAPARFARAAAPAQLIAASTQSSIATLPAMLASAARIGITERDAAVLLPLIVAVFKITAASNGIVIGVGLAWMAGVEVGTAQLAVAVPLAMLSTLAVLGLPGQVSVFAASLPIVVALGAPVELLPVLLAVDSIPDIFRTTTNVTADLATAAVATRDGAGGD